MAVVAIVALIAITQVFGRATPPATTADIAGLSSVGSQPTRADLGLTPDLSRADITSRSGDIAHAAPSDNVSALPAGGTYEPEAATNQWEMKSYIVQPGDTVSEIAERFGVSTNTVAWANGLDSNPDSLQVGQRLDIPSSSGVLHRVSEGDTLSDLADRYDSTIAAIAEANKLAEPYMIKAGDTIFVPGGRKAAPGAGTPAGTLVWPTYGDITFYFMQDGRHRGLDIGNSSGTAIYAADGGTVVTSVQDSDNYGWHIVIDHGNGMTTLYGHLSRLDVDYGDKVKQGDLIGLMGSTGLSTGPHLHFEVTDGAMLVDPLDYLP